MTNVSVDLALSMVDTFIKNTIQSRHRDLNMVKYGVLEQNTSSRKKRIGLLTKEMLIENNMSLGHPKVHSANRASSESSVFRLRRIENKPISTNNNCFPTVENAVKQFRKKMDGPRVVSIAIPLNKRQNFMDNSDEHRLKYYHRSVDELEKMSQNSERLRTVIDEVIDLDYIDIVYEANKPSKQVYTSLSCAPPLMPKHVCRRIKLQQRADSSESSIRENSESMQNDNIVVNTHNRVQNKIDTANKQHYVQNKTDVANTHDLLQNQKHEFKSHDKEIVEDNHEEILNFNVKSISVHIEYKSADPSKQNNVVNQDQLANKKNVIREENKIDPFNTPHRYSYFSQSNGTIIGVNRANTSDLKKVVRNKKH